MIIELREQRPQINDSDSVAKVLKSILLAESEIDRDKEHVWVIGVNVRNIVKYIDLVSLGTLNASLVHPREVFRLAVMQGVAFVILAHNHPSGESSPSEEDKSITRRLAEAGQILGIPVLDHIIITTTQHTSFKNQELL